MPPAETGASADLVAFRLAELEKKVDQLCSKACEIDVRTIKIEESLKHRRLADLVASATSGAGSGAALAGVLKYLLG